MNIPLNGRIAIIDDIFEQAEPLIRILSKKQIPYVFYKGNELSYLPEEDERYNDIRILFLDINLTSDTANPNPKDLKSSLYGVLKRVISPDNFPYVLIFWSRHQDEHSELVNELFSNELNDRKPIAIKSFIKSDFFPNFSDKEAETDKDLLTELEHIITSDLAYSSLLNWENQVHLSADSTLQNVFAAYHTFDSWQNNANFILTKLGQAYLGKHYKSSTPTEKVKSSFTSFNRVFQDTLDHGIQAPEIEYTEKFSYDSETINSSLNCINEKLNFSKDVSCISEPGTVISFKETGKFPTLLNSALPIFTFREIAVKNGADKTDSDFKKTINADHKKMKTIIKKQWRKVGVVVTPVCDYVQQTNKIYDRVVQGIMIPVIYDEYINRNTEGIYVLPVTFTNDGEENFIILDFRFFVTIDDLTKEKASVMMRVRSELLAEIQSKLARHINRQGILFLDKK